MFGFINVHFNIKYNACTQCKEMIIFIMWFFMFCFLYFYLKNENKMTSIIYPHAATIFAATCACIFVVIGVIGKFHNSNVNWDICNWNALHWIWICLFLGNLVTIIALRKCPKLQTQATTAFILSLCTSDLFFASVCLPLTAIRYINEVSVMIAYPLCYCLYHVQYDMGTLILLFLF